MMLYIPGGMMMLNYCVWNSIMEHEKAQMYLFDSTRVKSFTKYLEVLGIILTIVANLWNASVDKTVWTYLKEKGWFGYLERQDQSFAKTCCSCLFSSRGGVGEGEGLTPEEIHELEVAEASKHTSKVGVWKGKNVSGLKGMHGNSDE